MKILIPQPPGFSIVVPVPSYIFIQRRSASARESIYMHTYIFRFRFHFGWIYIPLRIKMYRSFSSSMNGFKCRSFGLKCVKFRMKKVSFFWTSFKWVQIRLKAASVCKGKSTVSEFIPYKLSAQRTPNNEETFSTEDRLFNRILYFYIVMLTDCRH